MEAEEDLTDRQKFMQKKRRESFKDAGLGNWSNVAISLEIPF